MEKNSMPRSNVTTDAISQLKLYLKAMRPWSFSASIIPAVLGAILSYKDKQQFSSVAFLLTLIIVISVHAAGNLINTYYDYIRGIDNDTSDDITLTKNVLTPKEVMRLSLTSYGIGFISFVILLFISPAKLEILALLFFCGLSGSYLYTGSIGLKYYALGDCLVLLIFGPACVVSSYTVQNGQLNFYPALYVIPIVLNTEAILHGNNSRDCDSDRQAGVLTIAILIGYTGSYLLYFGLIFIPYMILIAMTIKISIWFILPIFTIPYALNLDHDFKTKNLTSIAQNTAKLNLLFGLLYTISCAMM